MPLVTIHLFAGKSSEYVRALADGLHAALVETYDVPQEDRFQVIHELPAGKIVFSSSYLDVQRSEDVVLVLVMASRTRTSDQKRAFYAAATRNLANSPGLRNEDLQIILSSNEREDWSFGNGVASYAMTPELAA